MTTFQLTINERQARQAAADVPHTLHASGLRYLAAELDVLANSQTH